MALYHVYLKLSIPMNIAPNLWKNVMSNLWVTDRASFNVCFFYRASSYTTYYFNDMICNYKRAMETMKLLY